MKLALAQTRPQVGPVEGNVRQHVALIDAAIQHGAQMLVFPELSLTGYEPARAGELTRCHSDEGLNLFQRISDSRGISIAVGLPTPYLTTPGLLSQVEPDSEDLPLISLLLFGPLEPRRIYSKVHLHQDEKPFFSSGPAASGLFGADLNIAIAICYELTVPVHAAAAFAAGASVYVASVAKTARGSVAAYARLAQIACEYSMLVLMSNCLGWQDGDECAGGTAVWDRHGNLLAKLDDKQVGVLVVDSETLETNVTYLPTAQSV